MRICKNIWKKSDLLKCGPLRLFWKGPWNLFAHFGDIRLSQKVFIEHTQYPQTRILSQGHKDISKRLYAYPGLMPFPHSGEWKEVRQLLFGSSTTVTDCHKFGGLKQHTFIFSQFWRPKIWNQGWQGHTPSRGSWGEPIWCLFPASSSCHQPLAFPLLIITLGQPVPLFTLLFLLHASSLLYVYL